MLIRDLVWFFYVNIWRFTSSLAICMTYSFSQIISYSFRDRDRDRESSLYAPQLSWDDFNTDEELQKWITEKTTPWFTDEHPTILHENPRLIEYWYTHINGHTRERSSTIEEGLSRNANDLNAGLVAVGSHEPAPKKGASLADRHKSGIERVLKHSSKLQKQMLLCDGRLPSLKRKLSQTNFANLRAGLSKCRDTRERCLDKLEDLKEIPQEDHELTQSIESLGQMSSELEDCLSALAEAMSKSDPPKSPIKAESQSQVDGSEVQSQP